MADELAGPHGSPPERFSTVARTLLAAARSLDLTAPVAFRTPPRQPAEVRTIRRLGEGNVLVAVALRGRDDADWIVDMVEGLLAANGQPGARTNRELLLEAAYDAAERSGWGPSRERLGLKPRTDETVLSASRTEARTPACLDDPDEPQLAADQF